MVARLGQLSDQACASLAILYYAAVIAMATLGDGGINIVASLGNPCRIAPTPILTDAGLLVVAISHIAPAPTCMAVDRTHLGHGKSLPVRVYLGGSRILKKKHHLNH